MNLHSLSFRPCWVVLGPRLWSLFGLVSKLTLSFRIMTSVQLSEQVVVVKMSVGKSERYIDVFLEHLLAVSLDDHELM